MSKQQENARIAAIKAKQPVFISGLAGQHSLETGVAYHYRGHYVYACPAGTPIQPIPFVIKKGINIVGTLPELAPRYDPGASDLVPESSISALKKAREALDKERVEDEERKKREFAEALEYERTLSLLQLPQPATRRAPSMSSLLPSSSTSPFYIPHDRAHYLANSAPGSRFNSIPNTPHASRPVSPARAPLRQVSSTTRLYGLLSDNRGANLSDVAEGSFSLPGLDMEQDTNSSTEDAQYMREELASPPYSRNKPIGTGRPRRASVALNQAWNEKREGGVPRVVVREQEEEMGRGRKGKCVLHGEGCDGEYVANTWRTKHARETTGFRDLVPFVEGEGEEGRIMVDWERLVREERERRD